MKMKKWLFLIIAFFLLLSGCNEKKKENKATQPEKVNQPVTQQPVTKPVEKNPAPFSFPLTGLPSETSTDGRAIAVMINNHPQARPQSGLYKADIVYEILAEGDITRFLAIFQSDMPEVVGPIRSARDYFIDVAKGFAALYIAHGYSPEAKKMLQEGYIDNLNGIVYDGILFERSTARKAPHNSYITYDNIIKGTQQKHYTMTQTPSSLTFLSQEAQEQITGTKANAAMITYSGNSNSNCIYEFDTSLNKYKRFSGGEQTVDLETKKPILLDNVFIIEATHRVIDSKGRREIDLQTGGQAYLLQMGKVLEVEWQNDNGVIIPVKNGKKIPLVQGKTWVNVVPANPGLNKIVSLQLEK